MPPNPQTPLPTTPQPLLIRYVILHHTGTTPEHYDLMLQLPGIDLLPTWRILPPPGTWRDQPPATERLADHRPAYLTYEGPISDNRGQVRRVGEGEGFLTTSGEEFYLWLETLNCRITLPANA